MALGIVLAGLFLANVITVGPVSHPAYAQTVDSSIQYAENGTAPVGTFNAYDQDGDVISWSLSGPDHDLFNIDGGVLSFKKPPNHEDPQSTAKGGPRAEGNVYRVTIEASGGVHYVAVTVTDVDEAGTVSIDRPQPQVDRPLGASLLDEDEGVGAERWQWARSRDGTTWTDIEGAISPRRPPAPDDVGIYLRATVTYSDRFGSGKTASAVSANRAEARTLSNAAPTFADQDDDEDSPYIDVARSVAENTAVDMTVGGPISAADADDHILFYELVDTPDLKDDHGHARFTIDSASGQIRVGKELGADAGEREDEDSTAFSSGPALPQRKDAAEPLNSEYVLRVSPNPPMRSGLGVGTRGEGRGTRRPALDPINGAGGGLWLSLGAPMAVLGSGAGAGSAGQHAGEDNRGPGRCDSVGRLGSLVDVSGAVGAVRQAMAGLAIEPGRE